MYGSCLAKYRRMFPKMDVRRVRCSVCKADYTVEVHGFSIEAFEPSLPHHCSRALSEEDAPDGGTSSQTSFSC